MKIDFISRVANASENFKAFGIMHPDFKPG